MARGHANGRTQERATILTQLLTTKFGELSTADKKRIANAAYSDLERWTSQIFDASTIEEALQ